MSRRWERDESGRYVSWVDRVHMAIPWHEGVSSGLANPGWLLYYKILRFRNWWSRRGAVSKAGQHE